MAPMTAARRPAIGWLTCEAAPVKTGAAGVSDGAAGAGAGVGAGAGDSGTTAGLVEAGTTTVPVLVNVSVLVIGMTVVWLPETTVEEVTKNVNRSSVRFKSLGIVILTWARRGHISDCLGLVNRRWRRDRHGRSALAVGLRASNRAGVGNWDNDGRRAGGNRRRGDCDDIRHEIKMIPIHSYLTWASGSHVSFGLGDGRRHDGVCARLWRLRFMSGVLGRRRVSVLRVAGGWRRRRRRRRSVSMLGGAGCRLGRRRRRNVSAGWLRRRRGRRRSVSVLRSRHRRRRRSVGGGRRRRRRLVFPRMASLTTSLDDSSEGRAGQCQQSDGRLNHDGGG